MALPPHTPLVLLAAVVGSGVGFFLWGYRDAPGTRWLSVFMFAASVWSLAEGLALVSSGLQEKVFWTRVMLTVSPAIPVAWLATVLTYTGHEASGSRRRFWLLAIEPAVFVALVWTDGHGFVWQSMSTVIVAGDFALAETYGLAFWAHVAYSYALAAAGALVLVRSNFRTNRHFRSQNTALLVAMFVPLVAHAASVFDVLSPVYDLTSVGFVLTGIVLAGALYNWEFMEVAPATRELGREALIDELDDQVLILDDDDVVVDVNPAATDLLGVGVTEAVGRPLADLEPELADAVGDLDSGQVSLELPVGRRTQYFDVRVTPLYREGRVAGRLVSLRDVTDRQQREQRLDVLNRLLRHNLRNEMNVVKGNVELLLDELDDADGHAVDRLVCVRDTVDTVVERSEKLGRLSGVVDSETGETVDLSRSCTVVVESVRRSFPEAEFETDVDPDVGVEGGPSVRFAIEELLTNAVEHNDRERPRVTLMLRERPDGYATVAVTDNGPGIPEQERTVIESGRETDLEHGSGVGLWLVSWIARACGGSVHFENHDGHADGSRPHADGRGCTVSITLPVQRATAETTVEPDQ